jgi:RNA polymerase sigma-70 factor (TIGR02960 family)
VSTDLIARARAGDEDAFRLLVGPCRGELHTHCYRMLGSAQDAEDTLQETLLAAWRGLGAFEGRSSIRTWLYRIATTRCLNALRAGNRRPRTEVVRLPADDLPAPTPSDEVPWLEPYPDRLLDDLPDDQPGPEVRYEAKEAISLAFVTAVQLLPPRQRAVLLLRDVLGFTARQAAELLDTSEESVSSALKRARATLRLPRPAVPPPPPDSPAERAVVERFTHAFAAGDVDALVSLLTDDVRTSMPPLSLEYRGRELARRFHTAVTFRNGRTMRLVPTCANGQPAFGLYVKDPNADILHATGLLVITLAGDQISAMTGFNTGVLPLFGLPRTLPG